MDPVKAFMNPDFINSRDGRPIRMLAEYLEPKSRFTEAGIQDTIVFFGSARIKSREAAERALEKARAEGRETAGAERALAMSEYYEKTRELSRRLTQWSEALPGGEKRFVTCTGGGPGIMEAANRGAMEAGGISIGLGISLPKEAGVNDYVTPALAFEFHYFFTRKFWFTYMAKAVVAMPGGFGTMDELFEILTLIQTFKMKKRMPIVLFGDEYWGKVIDFAPLVEAGTINAEDIALMHRTSSVDDAFEYITAQLAETAAEGADLYF